MRSTTEIIMTYIQGEGLTINKQTHINHPVWFLWLMVGSSVVCCLSCLVWLVSSLYFFMREKPCTHPVQVIIIEEQEPAGSPKNQKRSSKRSSEDGQSKRKESVVQIDNSELGNP
ncbi:unnamed protein product [Caenorhabditis brenneri]